MSASTPYERRISEGVSTSAVRPVAITSPALRTHERAAETGRKIQIVRGEEQAIRSLFTRPRTTDATSS